MRCEAEEPKNTELSHTRGMRDERRGGGTVDTTYRNLAFEMIYGGLGMVSSLVQASAFANRVRQWGIVPALSLKHGELLLMQEALTSRPALNHAG